MYTYRICIHRVRGGGWCGYIRVSKGCVYVRAHTLIFGGEKEETVKILYYYPFVFARVPAEF